MKIRIVCVGGLKESYLRQAEAEYRKRLSPFCSLEITELAAEPLAKPGNDAQIAAALEAEAERILPKLEGGATVALCIEGKERSSREFAQLLAEITARGCGCLHFVIGGSCGLSPRVKDAADYRLSFSPMTFPHQLFRILLLEQLYRAYDILGRDKYDK